MKRKKQEELGIFVPRTPLPELARKRKAGVHKDKSKYDRKREKEKWKKEIKKYL